VTLPLSASGRGQGGGVTDAIAHQTTTLQSQGKTVVYLGDEGELLGLLAVTDTAREASRTAIEGLRGLGIDPVVMLTGDNHRTAAAIAKELGIERFEAELLPAEKLGRVEALVREHGSVAMVGDGINDAPALAAASVGVAMGAAGTGVALETADVALMGDELGRLPAAIALGRRAVRTIRWNIGLALGMKAAFIVLTLAGYGSLWLAVMADMGCSLLVVANSLRLLNGARSQAA
jgi:Cd2+/Zn2+-exporting ATPase